MEQEHRAPTPFEREIEAASRIHPLDVVCPPVEIVLTDEHLIYDRRTVLASKVQATLDELNAVARAATDGNVLWRRAILNYRDAGDHGHLPEPTTRHSRGRDGIWLW